MVFDAPDIGALPLAPAAVELHTRRLQRSYLGAFARPLLGLDVDADAKAAARALFDAPHAVLSHDVVGDDASARPDATRRNVFNYANAAGARLFERTLPDLVGSESTVTARVADWDDREELLGRCVVEGGVEYSGIRITARGRRFRIAGGELFNVVDERGFYRGQATVIDLSNVQMLD